MQYFENFFGGKCPPPRLRAWLDSSVPTPESPETLREIFKKRQKQKPTKNQNTEIQANRGGPTKQSGLPLPLHSLRSNYEIQR